MKLIFLKFALILSICICQEDQSYRLINKYGLNKNIKVSSGTSTEMRFKGIDIVTNFSAILNTTLVDSTDEFYKFNMTYDKVIAVQKNGEKTKPIHKMNKLNGEMFSITVNKEGEVIDKSAKTKIGEEFLAQSPMFQENYLYPFGSDSLRKPGDSWVVLNKQDFNEQPGFKSAEGSVISKVTYTFKKIKKKKDINIAYLNFNGTVDGEGYYDVMGHSMKGTNQGTIKGQIRFDITNGKVLKNKTETEIKLSMLDLESEKEVKFYQIMSISVKNKDD